MVGMTSDSADFGDDVYTSGVEDADDRDPLENLTGEYPEEPLDTGYSPPDREPTATRYGTTAAEQEAGESLDQRLAQEEPDFGVEEESLDEDGTGERYAEADVRAGRLVAPDEGAHADEESDLVAYDAGIAGSAASAEEAAMHVVEEGR
jgi:hypothetical protein